MLASLLLLAAQQAAPGSEVTSLHPDTLRADLEFLADDLFEGRRTGELGERAAARWIQTRFERAGLKPMTAGRASSPSWFQHFPAEPVHLDAERTFLFLGEQRVAAGYDFLPHPNSPSALVSGDAVFVGWGIHAPERGYSDFDGVDLEGKVAVLFRWEPGAGDRDHPWDGRRMTPESRLAEKVKECAARGAIAVLAATPPDPMQDRKAVGQAYWPAHSDRWRELNHDRMLRQLQRNDQLPATNFSPEDAIGQAFVLDQNQAPFHAAIPVGYLSPRMMRQLLRSVGQEAKDWVRKSTTTLRAHSFELALDGITVSVGKHPPERIGRNVIGMLPGRDPERAQEYVVVGAHFDHVGANEDGQVWNGADDNGSGTVALLGLADALASLPEEQRPKRSVIFVAFSGEELGLIGSYHFLTGGYVDPAQMVGMINLDMMGRSANSSVYVIGAQSGEGLTELLRTQAKGSGMSLRFDREEFFNRSDQVGFYDLGVPIALFTTERHDDYHTPRDTADLIRYEEMAGIATIAFRTVLELAHREDRIPYRDAYDRLQPVYGQSRAHLIAPIRWPDRLDY